MPREAAEKVSDCSRGAPKAGQRLLGTHVQAKTHGTLPTHSGSGASPGVADTEDCDVADDVLWGECQGDSGIASFIGKPAAETYYLISIGALDGVKKLLPTAPLSDQSARCAVNSWAARHQPN